MKTHHTSKRSVRLLVALAALLGVLTVTPSRAEGQTYPVPSWDWFTLYNISGNWDRNDPLNVMVYSSYANSNNYGKWSALSSRLSGAGWGNTTGNTVETYDHTGTLRGQDAFRAKGSIVCTTYRCRPKLRVWELVDSTWDHSLIAVADTHCCNVSPPAHYVDDYNNSQDDLALDVYNTRPGGSSISWWSSQMAVPYCLGNGNLPTPNPTLACSSYLNIGYAAPIHWSGHVEFIRMW